MDEQLIDLVETALEAKRQDEDALTLYWKCIQTDSQASVVPEAYCLLYTAWYQAQTPDELKVLVESACQRRFADIDVLSFMAEGEFEAKRYENTLKLYDRLLTLKALDAKGYQNLKQACFKRQSFDDFTNLLLQRCLKEVPEDESIIQFLLSQYLLHDKYTYAPAAPVIYQRILDHNPENLTVRSALCEYYYRQGKCDQAITEGETGLQYEKHHPDIMTTLAKAHYELGEYGKVVTYCRDVLVRRPGRGEIQVLLATVYARNALTTTEAIKNYQIALKFDPQNLPVRQALFRAYLRKIQVNKAIDECERLCALLSENHGISSREFQIGMKEMINEFERLIRRIPDDITLYLVTAKLYEDIGHYHKALIYYRTILELPLDTVMLRKLIGLLEKLTSFQMQNPHLYLYLGLLYHKFDRHNDAKLAFREVMYSDLDEGEVDNILVRHDRSIWQYPPVLVILAHHQLVTKDILEGLIQTFRQADQEDWKGVLWVLQGLYEIDDLLVELRQSFTWESFVEIYQHIIPILVYNGSPYAVQLLQELLSHPQEFIRLESLNALIQMNQPLTEQCLAEVSTDNPYSDVRQELAGYYAQQPTEQATDRLLKMLHDDDAQIRLYIVQELQKRQIQAQSLREVLFTEQDPLVKIEIIRLLADLQDSEEGIYLVHLLNDLVTKRYQESKITPGKVYSRLKNLISHPQKSDDIDLLSTLIQASGKLRLEEGIYSLATIAEHDRSQILRLEAIEAIGKISSTRSITVLQNVLHAPLESQDIRTAAEDALDLLVKKNPI